MRAQKVVPKKFEFYFPNLDNLILVENLEDGGVVIRATRDNFSGERRLYFIRELATEGFIPDCYQWWNDSVSGITWVIDISWLKIPRVWTLRSRKFMVRLLILSALFWLATMRVIYVSQPGYAHGMDLRSHNAVQSTGHLPPARR